MGYKIKLESELYVPVRDLFVSMGYKVNGEVKSCDLTAVKDDQLIIAEFKKSLTIELLLQAVSRQKLTEQVYIVIQKPEKKYRKWQDVLYLVKKLDVGLITVTFYDEQNCVAEIVVDAGKATRCNKSSRKRKAIMNETKLRKTDGNLGGSTRKKLLTGYREASIHIACCLESSDEELSSKELRGMGTNAKKTAAILRNNYYGWFEKVRPRYYRLSEAGREELLTNFCATADFYRKNISEMECDDGSK